MYAPKMQDLLRTYLVGAIDALAVATGRPRTHIVRAVAGHQSIVVRVTRGDKPITTALYDRMMGGISALWPEGAPWPDGIPRPEPDHDAIRRPEALATAVAEVDQTTNHEEVPHGA